MFASNRQFDSKRICETWGGKAPESLLDASVIYFANLGRAFSWEEFEQSFLDIWEARKSGCRQNEARDTRNSELHVGALDQPSFSVAPPPPVELGVCEHGWDRANGVCFDCPLIP